MVDFDRISCHSSPRRMGASLQLFRHSRRDAKDDAARTAASGRDVFASIDRGILVEDPYPHLVVENALPADLAATLLAEMPAEDVFTRGAQRGSNQRFALPSPIALGDERVSAAWKAALEECNASLGGLLSRVIGRLGGHLLDSFPDFPSRFASLDELRAVPRAKPDRRLNEVGMDAQMVINTPALSGGTIVRGPHLDQPDKLISALLYLRAPDDDSVGGELELYAARNSGMTFDSANDTAPDNVRLVRRYPYRHNLLIAPLGLPTALHGVSPRGATAMPRYHLHLVGELAAPLFTIRH
jgi:hypothetical protein